MKVAEVSIAAMPEDETTDKLRKRTVKMDRNLFMVNIISLLKMKFIEYQKKFQLYIPVYRKFILVNQFFTDENIFFEKNSYF